MRCCIARANTIPKIRENADTHLSIKFIFNVTLSVQFSRRGELLLRGISEASYCINTRVFKQITRYLCLYNTLKENHTCLLCCGFGIVSLEHVLKLLEGAEVTWCEKILVFAVDEEGHKTLSSLNGERKSSSFLEIGSHRQVIDNQSIIGERNIIISWLKDLLHLKSQSTHLREIGVFGAKAGKSCLS